MRFHFSFRVYLNFNLNIKSILFVKFIYNNVVTFISNNSIKSFKMKATIKYKISLKK